MKILANTLKIESLPETHRKDSGFTELAGASSELPQRALIYLSSILHTLERRESYL